MNNWRPITCLTSAYKIFALAFTRRISHLLDHYILQEQKGFSKGRCILDAITSLWEGIDFAKEKNLDFLFFKIDFDKAYDHIECDFILQSLHDFGLGRNFCKSVNILLGNARAKIALNGTLIEAISLKRSIRQGCPLASLFFVIVADALGWLVEDALLTGTLQGIQIPGCSKVLCLQQFADDTNALIINTRHCCRHKSLGQPGRMSTPYGIA